MDAAFGVCVELGLSGASVEAICAAAGFSRGAFYSNFSSKEELFFALLSREYRGRTENLQSRMTTLGEELSCRVGGLGRVEAASFIRDFFVKSPIESDWYVIEQEFLLLALRDPALAPDYLRYQAEFAADLSEVVSQIIAVAGRRFVIPAVEALPLLTSIYERDLRLLVLAGSERDDGNGGRSDLGDRVADLLFALTYELDGDSQPARPDDVAGGSSGS